MERRGYPHDHLREALIRVALDLIAAKGPTGFTFAEAARSAGVSPAAPYRHFRDRDELVADVARQGFEKFEALLAATWANARADAVVALERIGRTYLEFARAEPAYYAAMFESGLPLSQYPDLREAGQRTLAIVKAAAEAAGQKLPQGARPPATMVALHVFALAHGVATLFSQDDNAKHMLPMSPEDLLEAGLLVYLDGLGLRRGNDFEGP